MSERTKTYAAIALIVIAWVIASSVDGTEANRSRVVCFPSYRWDAAQHLRPCVRVRVFEDGSLRLRVIDADGTFRYQAGVGAKDR